VRAQSAVNDAKLKNARRIELFQQGIIAREDADTAQSTYDQAVASLDAASADVAAAQSGITSAQAGREVAVTQWESANAMVKQVTASLQQAQLDLAHTRIIAPVDGTVVSRNMDVGQTVAASFQAPTIFQIAQDLTKMEVDTNVDESDVGPIRTGQKASFTVDAYPGTVFRGEVAQIRKAPITVQNVVTYNVVVAVDNPDLKLFPGMTASVKIVTGTAPNAVRLPVAALRFRPATSAADASGAKGRGKNQGKSRSSVMQTQQTVYTLEQGQLKPARAALGLSDGNYVEVVRGLTEGQAVVTGTAGPAAAPAPPQPAPGTRRFGF
jgi:HlyD family secretion protein